jgi:prepilin signal peptidase PulO-like enzyme (type II secretory pathway)
MMLTAFSVVFGAALFGTAGWLGRLVSDTWYGAIEREADGPLAIALPVWAFVVPAACIGIAVGIRGATPLHVAVMVIGVLALTVCAATDVRTGMIPDLFTLGPLVLVLALAMAQRDWLVPAGAAFAFVPFAILAVASRGRGMGWGDVKLAALGGALVGMGGITLAVAFAALAASIVGFAYGRRRAPIAFGPYLAVSIGATLGLASST